MVTAIIFILILGVLIFVHELGHYLVAIRNGIKADEFGFGFPPRIFGAVKDDETGKYRFVFGGEHMKIGDQEIALVLVLQADTVIDRPDQMTQVQFPGRAIASK